MCTCSIFLYSIICSWTSRLLPWPSNCKQCFDEHWWKTHVCFSIMVSSGYMHSRQIVGHMVVLVFKGISILFHIVIISICTPTNNAGGFPFLYILSNMYYCSSIFFFLRITILTYVRVWSNTSSFFMCIYQPSVGTDNLGLGAHPCSELSLA